MIAVLGVGSNEGDRAAHLRHAIQCLKDPSRAPGLKILEVSPIYESDALLPDGAPSTWNIPYLNLALRCQCDLSPEELLATLKKIERLIGRKASERWAPRTIDIDILVLGDLSLNKETIKLPHPGILERPFAALPLADVLPSWIHPSLKSDTSISEWVAPWRRLPIEEVPFRTRRSLLTLTQAVGIINVTPDSFSDGNLAFDPESALSRAQTLVEQGADILDIGAESTRPRSVYGGPPLISADEEWNRLEPVLRGIKTQFRDSPQRPLISVDTRHPYTATKAIELGVDWINDVTGGDQLDMRQVISHSNVNYVLMHGFSSSSNKASAVPTSEHPIEIILSWATQKIEELEQMGISRNRLILDPGIGYGKTIPQNWEVLRESNRLHELGVKILIGHSRKVFLTTTTSQPPHQRDLETTIVSTQLAENGIDYLRVHHVESLKRSLNVWTQLCGISKWRN